jgi:hypothetical protein
MVLARALSHRTEKGKAYGALTAKFVAVLEALLWGFHNAATGRCFPSYERIAERARCARSTVYEAIRALERVGILTWVNRLVRVREWSAERDLYGHPVRRVRVLRTSNAYAFNDPISSKSDFRAGTGDQKLNLTSSAPKKIRPPLRGEHFRGDRPPSAAAFDGESANGVPYRDDADRRGKHWRHCHCRGCRQPCSRNSTAKRPTDEGIETEPGRWPRLER